jgi:NADH-quinone oxidoreductase subunit N
MSTSMNFTPFMPELVLLLAGLALIVVGAMRKEDGDRIVGPLAVIALVIAMVMALAIGKTPVRIFSGHFVFDAFGAYFKVLALGGAAASLLLSTTFLKDERTLRFEYALLVLFASIGMCMMVSANSLIAMYMALELTSLPLYVLAAFHRDQLRSTEAGLKYFVLGALASGMLLFGCSFVYGFTGTLSFDALGQLLSVPGQRLGLGVVVGIVFIMAGLAFKLAAVPFHMWTPDVYEGSPTPVTAFFASAPKIAAIGLTVRFLMQPMANAAVDWQQVVVVIALASMVLGAFAGVAQTNIKRLMAYSGIANVGYALVGLAAGTQKGVHGVLVFMAIYLVTILGTFGCILLMRRKGEYIETIADLAGLSRRQPLASAALAVFMFSLAGVPPLAGFIGKFYVFMAAVDAGLVWLAVIGLVTSVVAAYYYLRIVKLIYFDEPAEAFDDGAGTLSNSGVIALAAVLVGAFIIVPGPLLNAAQVAAAALTR